MILLLCDRKSNIMKLLRCVVMIDIHHENTPIMLKIMPIENTKAYSCCPQ